MNAELPPVAPEVVAAAVESLTSRLRKKLDAAVETYAALPVEADGGVLRVRCGEDAEVTLTPGPSGAVTDAERAVCSCLLAPRCLHRAAVLSACPVADAEDTAARLKQVEAGQLTIGMVSTAKYFLPPLLAQFQHEHPGVEIRLEVGNREQLV